MNETNEYTNYLKDVIFINEYDDYKKFTKSDENILKNLIMNKSFEPDENISSTISIDGSMYFVKAYRNISSALPEKEHSIENRGEEVEINISKIDDPNSATDEWVHGIVLNQPDYNKNSPANVKVDNGDVYQVKNRNDIHLFKWKDCVDQCYNTCHKYVETEVNSTAYMLRILTASVLGNTSEYKICFLVNPLFMNNNILGTWDHDKEFFKINIMKKSGEYNNTDWFEKEQYNIIKIDTPVNIEIKPREQYLTIQIPSSEEINKVFQALKNSLNGEKRKFPDQKNVSFNLYLQNKINKYVLPRIKNLKDANEIIQSLSGLKAFKIYSNDEKRQGVQSKNLSEGKYYISNKVLLSDDDKKIKNLIDELKEIQKNDTFIYQKTFNDTTEVTEPSGIIIKEDNRDPSTIKLPIEYTNKKNGRFILGAGPSASGKTYNAGLIIEMMKMVDPDFPGFFMTIDGGTYREKSVIYQTIVEAVLNKKQYPGLTNLMSANIIDKFRGVESIFETDSIKIVINDYLLQQTKRPDDNFVVSLYVPDTLTYCGIPTNCIPKLQKYIDITGDNNWIGLMIYQHKTGGDGCPLKEEYKCVGCTESGKKREKTEGKKYSSDAWKYSYDHGLQTIQKAPNFRFVFHNGGKPGRPSIFEDLSVNKIPYNNEEIEKFFTDKNIIYINGELTKNIEKCEDYLLKGCKTPGITPKSPEIQENIIRIDEDFIPYYQNKYVGIPKYSIDIINKRQFDNINSDDIVLLLAINNLITSGFLVLINEEEIYPTKLDDKEKTYNYYKIDTSNIDYNKVYDDMNTLMKNESIILYELEKIDKAFINFYENKYIGIDKTLVKNDEINRIMEEFIGSDVLKPIGDDINGQDLDENDKKYDYYKINFDNNTFHYFKDKDNFNTFIHDDSIIILDKEPNKGLNMWNTLSSAASGMTNKMFGVFNFTSLQKNGENVENLQELQTLNNAISNSDIQVDNNTNLIIVGNDGASEKINEELGENTGIVVENTTNNNGVQITTVKATTPESSISLSKILTNLGVGAGDIAKSIASGAFGAVSGASQALKGVFINKKNVDNDGNLNFDSVSESNTNIIENQIPVPPYEEETKPVASVETEPIINKLIDENDLIINTPPTKKKYIGIPKSEMMSDDDRIILNYLLNGKIIEKIDVDQNLLDEEKIPGYNEKNYDYYELKIEEHLRDRIRSINSIIHDDLNVLSKNNTLYIYEIEPDEATGVSNLSAITLFNNISGAITSASKNALSTLVGKITGESKKTKGKEEEIDESIIETNNKPPKCDNKKTTAKNTKSKGSNGTRKKNTTNDDENSVEIQGDSQIKNLSAFQRVANIAKSLTNTRKNKKDVVAPTRFSLRNKTAVTKYSE